MDQLFNVDATANPPDDTEIDGTLTDGNLGHVQEFVAGFIANHSVASSYVFVVAKRPA